MVQFRTKRKILGIVYVIWVILMLYLQYLKKNNLPSVLPLAYITDILLIGSVVFGGLVLVVLK